MGNLTLIAINHPPPVFNKYYSLQFQFLFHCEGNRTVGKDAAAKQQQC